MDTNYPRSTPVALVPFDRALADLASKGYKHRFRREPASLYCLELHQWITPEQFAIDESYFFKDPSSPDGDRLLYAVSTSSGIKGILVDSDWAYADNISREMREKLGTINETLFS